MLPPARCRQLPERRLDWVEVVLTAPRQCASASSTTASSRTPSAGPSAGTAASAERLAPDGHEVTYLTLRQWPRGRAPRASPGVKVIAVGPRHGALRRAGGGGSCRRSSSASACSATSLRHGRRYDVVHTASFPYFSLLAAARSRGRCGATGSSSTGTRSGRAPYWREYLGPLARLRRLEDPAALPADPPARLLPLGAARRAPARGGVPRRGDGPPRPVRGLARAAAGGARPRPP